MTKTELAGHLGISVSMVSRLAKRGMPTDTVERARRWRKRHLQTIRTKDHRIDWRAESEATPPRPPKVMKAPNAAGGHLVLLAPAADAALAEGAAAVSWLRAVREELRQLPADAQPRLSLRLWLALTAYFRYEESAEHDDPDQGRLLTPDAYAEIVSNLPNWGVVWLEAACDWDDVALHGWPADIVAEAAAMT